MQGRGHSKSGHSQLSAVSFLILPAAQGRGLPTGTAIQFDSIRLRPLARGPSCDLVTGADPRTLGAETMIDDEIVQNVGVAQVIRKMGAVDRDGHQGPGTRQRRQEKSWFSMSFVPRWVVLQRLTDVATRAAGNE
jgi:hypothetical protein